MMDLIDARVINGELYLVFDHGPSVRIMRFIVTDINYETGPIVRGYLRAKLVAMGVADKNRYALDPVGQLPKPSTKDI